MPSQEALRATDPLSAMTAKWAHEVVSRLRTGPCGFEELVRSVPGISPRVMSQRLTQLAEIGVVNRKVLDTRPPRVLYSLTDRGREALEALTDIRAVFHPAAEAIA